MVYDTIGDQVQRYIGEKIPMQKWQTILLYPCNLLGYFRLMLVMGSVMWYRISTYLEMTGEAEIRNIVAAIIGASLILDFFDGYLARKFNHGTDFGTLLDNIIDLTTHTLVWILSGFPFAELFIILEWTVGLCSAAFLMRSDTYWKTTLSDEGPALIKHYFRNNQRNLLSTYGNLGHAFFPLSLFAPALQAWVTYISFPGMVLYEIVTLYMLYVLMRVLLVKND